MTNIRKKNNFSLLEVMIAIAIIAMAATTLSFKINALIDRHRFNSSFFYLKNKLLNAKQMAIVNQNDVIVELVQNNKMLICNVSFDGDNNVKTDAFPNFFFINSNKDNSLKLFFTSNGYHYPQDTISICYKKNKKEINLKNLFL